MKTEKRYQLFIKYRTEEYKNPVAIVVDRNGAIDLLKQITNLLEAKV